MISLKKGQPVGQRWFKREGKRIFKDMFTSEIDRSISQIFKFGTGWFRGYCYWWNLSWRLRIKATQDSPEAKEELILCFLQEIQQKSLQSQFQS